MLSILQIELDAHHNGGPPLRPWVARITGTSPKYGLEREFIRSMNDWKNAHVAGSGNTYGIVAMYPLHSGNLYEVCRPRGRSSKRYLAREFVIVDETTRKRRKTEPMEVLAIVDGGDGPAFAYEVPEGKETWVARVSGLGMPRRLGWVMDDNSRVYRLINGVHEVVREGVRSLVLASDGRTKKVSEKEAVEWLHL